MITRVRINSSILSSIAVAVLLDLSCVYHNDPLPIDCSSFLIEVPAASMVMPTGCSTQDGSFIVVASGGKEPYQFSIDDGITFQDEALFQNLDAGTYSILVKDANVCELTREDIVIDSFVSTISLQVLPANIVNPTRCEDPDGSIVASPAGGTGPYEFALNGGDFQSDALFTSLSAGIYTVTVKDSKGCESIVTDVVLENSGSTLSISIPSENKINPTSCVPPNGSIIAVASGGEAPYQYALNNGAFQSEATFQDLAPGTYSITVKDADGCLNTVSNIVLADVVSTLTVSETSTIGSGCKASSGSISITASGGQAPYQYSINGTTFVSSSTIGSLASGTYIVTIKDALGCVTSKSGVKIISGVRYESEIKPILQTNCIKSGCHNGGNSLPNFNNLTTVQANAQDIKTTVLNGSMPKNGTLSQQEKDIIACWVDDGALNN